MNGDDFITSFCLKTARMPARITAGKTRFGRIFMRKLAGAWDTFKYLFSDPWKQLKDLPSIILIVVCLVYCFPLGIVLLGAYMD